jgi:hypothetical protein
MRRGQSGVRAKVIEPKDLVDLGQTELAQLLTEQIANLPYRQQKQWAQRHLPEKVKRRPPVSGRASSLIHEVEEFCSSSRSGAFVAWVDDHEWYSEDDSNVEGEEFQEWVELFTDLMKGTLELTRSGRHQEAVKAYKMLLELFREAGETTDILGNHGAPEDSIGLDFGKVVEAYARSLLACRSTVDEAITEILPVAKRFRYAGGFAGLARALDRDGRKRLETRLSRAVGAALRSDRRDCPAEVEGLIALAGARRDQAGVLSLKERFSARNAVYLREVLSHYRRKRDWRGVARLAEVGIRRFGHRREFAEALVWASEASGDSSAAQEAQIAHFREEPGAGEFAALRRRSEALSNWDTVFERLLRAAASPGQRGWLGAGLRTRILLAEGREREALAAIAGRHGRLDFDETKLVAKYAVARLSEGVDLARFKKLKELQARLKREKDDSYDWLRLILEKPGTLSRTEYARVASDTYRKLVDLHLGTGKSSRAAPAAHYCAIVAEVSRLADNAELWTDLLRHLRERHGRKRLIWDRLKAEGCPPA